MFWHAVHEYVRHYPAEWNRGQMVPQAAKRIGVTEQVYYRWRKEYGGLRDCLTLSQQQLGLT